MLPLKAGGELRCSGRVSSGTRRVNLRASKHGTNNAKTHNRTIVGSEKKHIQRKAT